jgi:tryptophan halogenase
MFPAASYQYVLFGMGFRMDTSDREPTRHADAVQQAFARNESLKTKWTKALPNNRHLISKIREFGLQRI